MRKPLVLPTSITAAIRTVPLRLLAAGLVAALTVSACGGDDSDNGGESEESGQEASGDSQQQEPEDQSEDTSDGEVPDPCSLVSSAELSSILGSDPGTATPNAVVPDERKVCMYDSGLILGVELASHFTTSVSVYEGEWGPMEDVPGVGNEAKWRELEGGIGSFYALGDEYFVDITLNEGRDAAEAMAEAMLAAL